MPLSVAFSTSQTIGATGSINIVDSTTGSDVTATQRRIYFVTATGQYLTTSGLSTTIAYVDWPIAQGTSLTITGILTEDMALDVTLAYLNVSSVIVAELTQLQGFKLFNESFYYSLTQSQASQNQPSPMIIQDSNYFMNKMIFRVLIDSGDNAITYGSDIVSAQNMYSLATYMRSKEANFF